MAATVVYVNPDADPGGDGTTNALTGANCAYQSLSIAEAAAQLADADLTDNSTTSINDSEGNSIAYALIFRCAGTTNADTTACVIDGFTTDPTHRIMIEADTDSPPNSDGWNQTSTFSNSYYRMQVAGQCLRIDDQHVTVRRLQFRVGNVTGNNQKGIIYVSQSSGNIHRVEQCRFEDGGIGSNNDAIDLAGVNTVCTVHACAFAWHLRGSTAHPLQSAAATLTAVNNTIYTADRGINDTGGITVARNNAIANTGDDMNLLGTTTVQFNAADDDLDTEYGESTNLTLDATGTPAYANEWTDAPGGDFTIAGAGSTLADAGTSTGAPLNDLVGTAYGTQDIGCFAFTSGPVVGPPPTMFMRNTLGANLFDGPMIR